MDVTLTVDDLLRLAVLFGTILALLGVSEILRRRLGLADEFTRKFVHIATGAVIFIAPPFFANAGPVVLIAAVFVLLNALAYTLGVLKAVHHTTRPSFGTVYYPLALLLIALPFWNTHPDIVVAAIMVMAVGDAAAGITGESLRHPHHYHVTSDPKSLEGSTAMFAGGLAALLLSLTVYADDGLTFGVLFRNAPFAAIAGVVAVAAFATGWEAASSRGLDNITVPVMTAIALHVCFASGEESAMLRFATGAGLGLLIAVIAFHAGMLQMSGAVATFLLATVVYGVGGWQWTLPIFSFFLLSSLLSKWRKSRKQAFDTVFEKGGRRDAGQVAANGALVGILAILWHFTRIDVLYILSLAVLAVVTADTWGTEIGVLARQTPRSILGGKRVPAGTSGGITLAGTAGGAAGAIVVTLSALFFLTLDATAIVAITMIGVLGSLVDSVLGATLQAQYRCRVCGNLTERRRHCAMPAELTRGFRRINNDAVNFLSALTGILIGLLLFL
ncbi:MAG: DUF92 domain-containing protein [Bacteroidetes bacterium]|nr:DUF92 domain-containing protein [Bacteroidota bacterium]